MKIILHFLSFLNTEMAQVAEILPRRRQQPWKWANYYPWLIRAVGYCRALCRMSVCSSIRPSRLRYHSADHNISQKMFPFGLTTDLNMSMNPIDYGVSMFIFYDLVALWNFMNTLTDLLLGLGRPRDPVLWTIFSILISTPEGLALL